MRKIALLTAVAAATALGSVSRADFIYRINPTINQVATGPLAGDDIVQLQIESVTGTAQSNSVNSYSVKMSSIAASPKFFIRTWNSTAGAWDDTATPQGGTNGDFGNLGTLDTLGNPRPNGAASFVRLGAPTAYLFAGSTPPPAGPYTDYQSLSSLSVDAGVQPSVGNIAVSSTAFVTMAQAVVPHGQDVTFTGKVISSSPNDTQGVPFAVSTIVPEPVSLSAFGAAALGLLARRRRA